VYEVTWTRLLGLVFGNTTYAVATTLAAFMAGLALGSAAFGRRADASADPLRLYAGIELGIAITAGLTPLALPAVSLALAAVVRSLGGAAGEAGPGLTAARFTITFAILLVPTALMGATLPVPGRYFVREAWGVGAGVGALYAVNTLGAVVGVFGTGFLFIQLLGVRHTILLAAGLNLLAALVAFWATQRPAAGASQEAGDVGDALKGPQRLIALGLFAASGAAALAYEVLLTRTLLLTLNTTTYAFATMLTTFLAGIALGSTLAAPLTRRLRDLPLAFGLTELGIGLAALGSVAVMAGLRPSPAAS
jgi:spermidine synthase